jgi:glutaminase
VIEATELEYWASLGRLEQVASALAANPDVNIRGVGEHTAMHAAATNGHLEVIRFLASHGADLSPRVETGETPLDLAILAGQHAAVELLRSLGAKQADPSATPAGDEVP